MEELPKKKKKSYKVSKKKFGGTAETWKLIWSHKIETELLGQDVMWQRKTTFRRDILNLKFNVNALNMTPENKGMGNCIVIVRKILENPLISIGCFQGLEILNVWLKAMLLIVETRYF